MSLISAVTVSLSGMNAATRRLEVSASNVANAGTIGTVPTAAAPSTVYRALTAQQSTVQGGGVATTVVQKSPAYDLQAQPGSPFADERGLVAVPNVDYASEAVDQITARLGYEASAEALKVADDMLKRTTDILS